MCLYPQFLKNPKYLPNKKNNYNPPLCDDARKLYIPTGCGNCVECRKQKASGWRVRLMEEIKEDGRACFVTLTFNEDSIIELEKDAGDNDVNKIATLATRRFLERWRKKHKKSIKHWLVTEMGHEGTERIHLHGLIFTTDVNEISTTWKYGFVYIGDYVNEETINYIVKYLYKLDDVHKGYMPVTLCSPGIGKGYLKGYSAYQNRYNGRKTKEIYKLNNGQNINLPTYYRNKIYSEKEREELWVNKIKEKKRYVMGIEIDISKKNGLEEYMKAREYWAKKNEDMGFGNRDKAWNKKKYTSDMKKINE